MNLISTANIILTLIPVISDTVKSVEALHNTGGNGKAKLDLALSIVKSVYEASNPPQPFDSLVGHITAVITALVTFYNSVKAFATGTTAKAA